jgi:hypothetical protein
MDGVALASVALADAVEETDNLRSQISDLRPEIPTSENLEFESPSPESNLNFKFKTWNTVKLKFCKPWR